MLFIISLRIYNTYMMYIIKIHSVHTYLPTYYTTPCCTVLTLPTAIIHRWYFSHCWWHLHTVTFINSRHIVYSRVGHRYYIYNVYCTTYMPSCIIYIILLCLYCATTAEKSIPRPKSVFIWKLVAIRMYIYNKYICFCIHIVPALYV